MYVHVFTHTYILLDVANVQNEQSHTKFTENTLLEYVFMFYNVQYLIIFSYPWTMKNMYKTLTFLSILGSHVI